jgi:3-phenylpropionate/cinnamic acid dioxygenase small subunit
MSDLKYCQGPDCHTYSTQDRLKGMKGSKTYQTRRRSSFYYGQGNFCDQRCMYDWFHKFGEQAIDHFGRTTEVKHLTEQNAWVKGYDWDSDYSNRTYVYRNGITKEQRPLTREQYQDTSYTLNTGE